MASETRQRQQEDLEKRAKERRRRLAEELRIDSRQRAEQEVKAWLQGAMEGHLEEAPEVTRKWALLARSGKSKTQLRDYVSVLEGLMESARSRSPVGPARSRPSLRPSPLRTCSGSWREKVCRPARPACRCGPWRCPRPRRRPRRPHPRRRTTRRCSRSTARGSASSCCRRRLWASRRRCRGRLGSVSSLGFLLAFQCFS